MPSARAETRTHTEASQPPLFVWQASLALSCVIAFAVYANAVQLMPLHDDHHILARIRDMRVVEVFSPASAQGFEYRPVGTVLWIFTRDLFGWFTPGVLHFWNVALHTLNVALVGTLVRRLTWRNHITADALPILSALSFALFPFSYQAVAAGAVYHPVMLVMGLAALHAYLSYRKSPTRLRFGLCASFLILACLSHEVGFVFGPLILLLEGYRAYEKRTRPYLLAIGACATLVYPVLYRLGVDSMWTPSANGLLTASTDNLLDKVLYYGQGLLWWAIAPLRPLLTSFDLNPTSRGLLLICGVASIIVGLAIARRANRITLAIFGLAWWVLTLLPSIATLRLSYILDTPRLMYTPSVGLAIFSGACLWSLFTQIRWPAFRVLPIGVFGILLMWSSTYITSRITELRRLTPAFTVIDAAVRAAPSDAKIVLINPPFVLLSAQPSFLFGREGFSLWEPQGYGPVEHWVGSTSGAYRPAEAIRHVISLSGRDPNSSQTDRSFTLGNDFKYGVFGREVDDAALRAALLDAANAFVFDYDAPGIRARQVSHVTRNSQPSSIAHATFVQGNARVQLLSAKATRCGAHVRLQLTWQNAGAPFASTGVFVHGYAAGQKVFDADQDLLNGVLPVNALPGKLMLTETREIRSPVFFADIDAIHIGLYLRQHGTRFDALQAGLDKNWSGNEVIVPLQDDAATQTLLCGVA
jgi:hypothetical protein